MMEKLKEQLFIWDPIEGIMEDCESEQEFDKYVKENYMEDNGELHPDIEMIQLMSLKRFVVFDDENQKLIFSNHANP